MCSLVRRVILHSVFFYWLIHFIANIGFSLGINDVIPGPILSDKKDSLVEKAYADCLDLIALAKKGKLDNKPGCDQEQTLEAMISSVLSQVRDKVGKLYETSVMS